MYPSFPFQSIYIYIQEYRCSKYMYVHKHAQLCISINAKQKESHHLNSSINFLENFHFQHKELKAIRNFRVLFYHDMEIENVFSFVMNPVFLSLSTKTSSEDFQKCTCFLKVIKILYLIYTDKTAFQVAELFHNIL